MQNPKISIVIPVYNIKKYLGECIDSVLNQTFTEFELILVNDGSTDGSGNICDEYKKKDSRVIVIHQENSGVSCARNKGIDAARGDYIAFVDSDDIIEKSMFEKQYLAIIENDVDCVISGITYFYEEVSLNKTFSTPTGKVMMFDDFNDWYNEFDKNFVLCSPCSKLYKKSIIKKYDIKFAEKFSILEDGMFEIDYLSSCKSVYCLGVSLYFYRQFDGISLMKKFNHNAIEALEIYIEKYNKLIPYLNKNNLTRVYDIFISYFLYFIFQIYTRSSFNNYNKYSNLKKSIKKIYKTGLLKKESIFGKRKIQRKIILILLRLKMVFILHCIFTIKFIRKSQ